MIHARGFRCKHHIHAALFGEGAVTRHIARVTVQVFILAKLDRVNKDGQHQHIGSFSACAQQRGMALMQVAHGGHKGDSFALAFYLERSGLHLCDGIDDLQNFNPFQLNEWASVGNSPFLTSLT